MRKNIVLKAENIFSFSKLIDLLSYLYINVCCPPKVTFAPHVYVECLYTELQQIR
jgi:hypothetical protein